MAGTAHAQYPDRPIRIVVPFAAGGPADLLGRLLANGMSTRLNATVVVENKPGAGGNIGTAQAAKSAADGYTLVIGYIGPFAINPSLYEKQLFNPAEDFAPITLLASSPLVLVTPTRMEAGSVADLVSLAKNHPQGLTYASGGVGSANHLAAELFRMAAGIKLLHVPYQGIAPATTDLLSGQVDLMFNGVSSALPHIRSGKLKALAVTTRTRLPALPDIKTMEESGIRPFDVSAWFGLLAPKGTPPEILRRLEQAARDTMMSREAGERLGASGLERRLMPSAEFAGFMQSELKTWTRVVRDSGARAD